MNPFPWSDAMRFGFGVLRLSSAEFWRLTPRELASAFEAGMPRARPLSREALEALQARYPDAGGSHGR